MEKVSIAYLWGSRKQATGPITYSLYIFNPWCNNVWDVDAEIMIGQTKLKGG